MRKAKLIDVLVGVGIVSLMIANPVVGIIALLLYVKIG